MRQIRWIGMSLLMLLATAAWAADVTGKWEGKMALNESNQDAACAHLKQNGAVITGTMGASDKNQFPITSGHIDGDQVTIEARPGPAVLRLTMKLQATMLAGDVFENDRKIGTVELQKVEK